MSSFKFELNRQGVRELLKSEGMQTVCDEYARGIAKRAGPGYVTSSYVGKNRVNTSVSAETYEAYRDNLENNTLLKAVGG